MSAGWFRRLIEVVLPTRCSVCQVVGAGVVCPQCLALLQPVGPYRCSRCGRCRTTPYASPDCGECHGRNIGVAAARSCLVYNAAGRQLLADFKYSQRLGIGDELIRQMLEWLEPGLPALYGLPDIEAGIAVPVPLHRSRLLKRKFNQAEMIAERISAPLGLDCRPGLLYRVKDTKPQFGLSPQQRAENMQGAFAVPPGKKPRLKGRDVLLIDDLMT
ncbi:MAG TPA: ComF family protein, partial [Firmicutes bacterium]|nr:ComF family protein [Bacillota bacterium]